MLAPKYIKLFQHLYYWSKRQKALKMPRGRFLHHALASRAYSIVVHDAEVCIYIALLSNVTRVTKPITTEAREKIHSKTTKWYQILSEDCTPDTMSHFGEQQTADGAQT